MVHRRRRLGWLSVGAVADLHGLDLLTVVVVPVCWIIGEHLHLLGSFPQPAPVEVPQSEERQCDEQDESETHPSHCFNTYGYVDLMGTRSLITALSSLHVLNK